MKKLGWLLIGGLAMGLALAVMLVSTQQAQAKPVSQDPLWRMDGRVLDTSGAFGGQATAAFNSASAASGYPVYLLIVDKELLEGNDKFALDVAHEIFQGSYGEQYQWRSDGKANSSYKTKTMPYLSRTVIRKW